MTSDIVVSASALRKSYDAGSQCQQVLDGVDLRVAAGEIVVIIGRSGSGKSTLLNLIGAMDRADSGELNVAGTTLADLNEDQRTAFRRKKIGFVFQAYNLVPTLTVEENLRLPLSLLDYPLAEQHERIDSALDQLGLGEYGPRFPETLSGGEQQRVAVARALIHEPELIIADEPTGNLDIETGRLVLSLLDTMTRRSGRSLLMATHSAEVIGMADQVFRIGGGRLEALPDDLSLKE